jgi:hypothetical protein
VVGPKLADECVPIRLEGGLLTLAASSPAWAAQLNFLASDIARKANDVVGSEAVKQVRVQIGPERPSKRQSRRSEA